MPSVPAPPTPPTSNDPDEDNRTPPGNIGDDGEGDEERPPEAEEPDEPADTLPPAPSDPLPDPLTDWQSVGSPGLLPNGQPGASSPVPGRVPAVQHERGRQSMAAPISVLSAKPSPLVVNPFDPGVAPPNDTATAQPTANTDPYRLDEVTVSRETIDVATRSAPPSDLPPHGDGARRSIVFPVLGPVTYHDGWGDCRDGCERRHEGTDILGVRMQPLLAAVDGTVNRLQPEVDGISGAVISITDGDGWRYNYFHLNNDTPGTDDAGGDHHWRIAPGLAVGDTVRAGQIIGYMGDSGNAEHSVSHLHFEFRDPSGNAQPSYWSLRAAAARQACTIGIGPWSFPHPTRSDAPAADIRNPRVASAAVDMTTTRRTDVRTTRVTPLFGDGEWLIDSEGRVTATGSAALVAPTSDVTCTPGPTLPFGTDAAGWRSNANRAILAGTTLEGAELTGTALAAQLTDAGSGRATASDATPVPAFRDPSTGEVIVVLGS